MIGVVAILRAKEGQETEFERTFAEMTAEVKAKEPGNVMYQLTKTRTEPRTYKVLEMYADQAAFDAHVSSEHYKNGGLRLRNLVVSRPEIEVLDALT